MSTDNNSNLTTWTEIEYPLSCRNSYLVEPVFQPKEVVYNFCEADGNKKPSRLTFAVFNTLNGGEDDWEDDPMVGEILVTLLEGDDDVSPAKVYYLGVDAEDFITLREEDKQNITFAFYWPHGEISSPKAINVENSLFTFRKSDFEDGSDVALEMKPRDGEPFVLHIKIPLTGFQLTDAEENSVKGEISIASTECQNWKYAFEGTPEDDRFSIAFDGDRLNYLYIWHADGTMTIRNMRDRLAVIGDVQSAGTLKDLMGEARTALIKHGNNRWRITIEGAAYSDEELPACDAKSLSRFAFEKFINADESELDNVAKELMTLERKLLFQWFWLFSSDWSHENLEGLLDLDGIDSDPEKMMQQALLFNRYDMFMKKLRQISYDKQEGIQGDMLQVRNNKKKIARVVRRITAHLNQEESAWELEAEDKEEIIHFFHSFHAQVAVVM